MTTLALEWTGAMSFRSAEGHPPIALASSAPGATSPVEALGYAVMGCMAMDVVHVLTKGRHRLDAMSVTFEGERAPEPPRRFVRITLGFALTTSAPAHVVERAIQLSREKYCSVWHSLREDIELVTDYTLTSVAQPS